MKNIIYDLKFLTGVIFTYLGIVLAIFGLITNKTTEHIPYNVNLWWGLVTLLFGLSFLIAALVTNKNSDSSK